MSSSSSEFESWAGLWFLSDCAERALSLASRTNCRRSGLPVVPFVSVWVWCLCLVRYRHCPPLPSSSPVAAIGTVAVSVSAAR